jgi:hypothetical protein
MRLGVRGVWALGAFAIRPGGWLRSEIIEAHGLSVTDATRRCVPSGEWPLSSKAHCDALPILFEYRTGTEQPLLRPSKQALTLVTR